MSPTKEVMMLLVQSIKGVTKMTGVVDIEVTQGYFSEIGNYNIKTCFQIGSAGSHPGLPGALDLHSCHHKDQQTSSSRIGASPEDWCCSGLPSGHKCAGFSQAAAPSAN